MTETAWTGRSAGGVTVDDSAAVRIVGLSKTFETRSRNSSAAVHAVRDVSFSVPRGACLGIAGESGSGKSTVARMMVGLEVPTAGEIWVEGSRLPQPPRTADRRAHARRVQMVFQDPYSSLDPRQTIAAAIDEVQRVHFQRSAADRRTRLLELLDAVGVGERYADALPRSLSGGQRQRLAIARALAAEPAVLVLDEAVSALDVSTQAQILNLLSDLRTEFSLTYVFISHDLAVIRQISDEVLVLYRGRLMELSSAESLFVQPANPYTQLLLDSVPRPGMELEKRPDRGALDETGCLFADRCPQVHARCVAEPPEFPLPANGRSRCWLSDTSPTSGTPPAPAPRTEGAPNDQY
jgi:oligopeptide/dipeptide ABC transporter ATP-binding protein